jgi:hypothetical protein
MNLRKFLAATSRSRWRGGELTSSCGQGEVTKRLFATMIMRMEWH